MLKFAASCGTNVPQTLHQRFDGLDDDPETRRMIAASVAIEQVDELRRQGVDEFHFYTLNRAELTYAICHTLGLRPRADEQELAS
jgi:methylenetetrahydrofolate reductase (NADPH)